MAKKGEILGNVDLCQRKPGSRVHGYDVVIENSGPDDHQQVATERIEDLPRPVALSVGFRAKAQLTEMAASEGAESDIRVYEQTAEGEGPWAWKRRA